MELLIVIAIIAVLATIGTQVGSKAINNARKMQSLADVTNICGAIEGLKADNNGVYPNIAGGGTTVNVNAGDTGIALAGGGAAGNLVAALLGDDTVSGVGGDPINGRGSSYLEAPQAKGDGRGGVDIGGTHSFTDYWGNAYQVIWDSDYDDKIDNPLDAGEPAIRRGVIALGQGTSEDDLSGTLSSKDKLGVVTSW